ncbi:MAG: hypothetical protein ACE5E8_01735 [Acidimicrobiia bacterium]
MRVNCGRCHTEFVVQGPGEYACPACGTTNRVGATPAAGEGLYTGSAASSAPRDAVSPRMRCNQCEFEFIVGEIEVAVCPNCGSEVAVNGDS